DRSDLGRLFEQAVRDRVADELGATLKAQLLHYVRAMRLRGAHRDEQLLGDLLVREAEREQPEDLALAVGQGILFRLTHCLGLRGDEARAKLWVDVPTSAGHLPDRRHDLGISRFLEHVAARSSSERLPEIARIVLHREHE